MDTPSPELVQKALRKIMAAAGGVRQKAVAVGATAGLAWGATGRPEGIEILLADGDPAHELILSAARGEGLQQGPGGAPLQLRYADARFDGSVPVRLLEASTPFLKRVL